MDMDANDHYTNTEFGEIYVDGSFDCIFCFEVYSGVRVIASRILHEIFLLLGELHFITHIPKLMIYSKLPFIQF